jgi:acetoacetate decarboxylase
MRQDEVLKLPSMPAAGPSYPAGPYRFMDREFLIITYETDPDVIRDHLPEPLEPIEQPLVHYEWIKMPDSSGFGSYMESGMVIPSRLRGEEVNFVTQMYLDDDPPIAAGREIWGFPKKYAHPKLEIVKDTLTGTLSYAGQLVAMGTMGYKHESMAGNGERTRATLSKTQINLKLIPGVDGHPEIAQSCYQPGRHCRQGVVDWSGPASSRSPCQCAGCRSTGTASDWGSSFSRRPHPALWQGGIRLYSPRICRAANPRRSGERIDVMPPSNAVLACFLPHFVRLVSAMHRSVVE